MARYIMVKLIGVPPEWKVHQHRVKCSACGSEQWSKTNVMPIDHHRPDGRVCRKARYSHRHARFLDIIVAKRGII